MERNIEQEAWKVNAKILAEYVWKNMVNRTDFWGACAGGTDNGRVTRPKVKNRGKHFLTQKVIQAHFELSDDRTKIIGLHSISPQNTSRGFAIDIDLHDDDVGVDPKANEAASRAWVDKLKNLGLNPLLMESNGNGGYHLRVNLDQPAPTSDVYAFAKALVADYATYGLKTEPETFPKQSAVNKEGKGQYGNWLRLFGKGL